mgnify:CR=1 FL=1
MPVNLLEQVVQIVTSAKRESTYIVAASDAPAHVIAQADYKCDGVADNVQIQAAIDALPAAGGGKIRLTQGTFNLAAALTAGGNTFLEGAGIESTTISVADNVNGIVISEASTYGGGVKDLTLKVEGAAVIGISVSGVWKSCLESLKIEAKTASYATGIRILSAAYLASIRNCRIIGFTTYGINLAANGCVVDNCDLIGISGSKDIYVESTAQGCKILNNWLESASGRDVRHIQTEASYTIIYGNAIDGMYTAASIGVYIVGAGARNCLVVGNTFDFSKGVGIQIDTTAGESNIIASNTFSTTTDSNAILVAKNNQTIDGNNIYISVADLGTAAVYLGANAHDIVVSNNTIKNTLANPDYGIYVGGLRAVIKGNIIDKWTYGISLAQAGSAAVIEGNNFLNMTTAGVDVPGNATVIHHNAGFVTENSGASTGTGAQQTIAHGLGFTPTRQRIALTAGSATALPFHSADPDATNIYVTAALNQPWYWARVG